MLAEDELQLINALQLTPRNSWQAIGNVLGCHPSTAKKRWLQLRARGAAWITAHLPLRTDAQTIALVDVECEFQQRDALAAQLCSIPEVLTVETSTNGRDLMLIVCSHSWDGFANGVLPSIARMPQVRRHTSLLCTRIYETAQSWNIGSLSSMQMQNLRSSLRHSPSAGAPPRLFSEIAEILALDGRATANDIALRLDVTPVTARRQLSRIANEGLLTFRCEIAQPESGKPLGTQWRMRLPPTEHEEASAFLSRFPELRFCATTMGSTNFTFMMWLSNPAQAANIEKQFLTRFPRAQVLDTQPTQRFFKRMGWILGPDGTTTGEVVPLLPAIAG